MSFYNQMYKTWWHIKIQLKAVFISNLTRTFNFCNKNVENLMTYNLSENCWRVLFFVLGCPCITRISLTPQIMQQATAHHLRQIYLRTLDMTDCYALEDEGLQVIATHCSQLQFLYLRRCVRIGDAGLQYIAYYCSGLKELSISDCKKVTDFGVCELAKIGTNLRYLSVAKCDKISDVGIRTILTRA